LKAIISDLMTRVSPKIDCCVYKNPPLNSDTKQSNPHHQILHILRRVIQMTFS